MLTHEIVINPVPQKVKRTNLTPISHGRLEFKRRQRLKQDLKNRKLAVGDTAIWGNECYGTITEIISNYDDVLEWDGTKPLNVLFAEWESGEEWVVNIFDLEKL
ncbi:MAG TPA: hypothetical protein VFM18_11500 [Methanosarcina sp.]|nr:hypothetical protein [Methanosarcina sp.]